MKQLKMFLLASFVMLLTACGGGGGSLESSTQPVDPQAVAINTIKSYADNNTNPAPTLLTYKTAGVVGITPENIDDINDVVASLTPSDVDTTEKIQKIVNDLRINIVPMSNAGQDKSVQANQTVTITGSGTDSDGTIVSYKWRKGTALLASTALFDYTPTIVGIDTLTLTVTDNNGATATDSMIVTVTAVLLADTIPPVITLNGVNPMDVVQGGLFIDAGATAVDDRDGTVSVTIRGTVDTSIVGSHTLTYTATDSAGNIATKIRTVNVVLAPDTTAPVITVAGNDPETVIQDDIYTDAGATAVDDRDGTVSVTTTGTVDTSIVGTYTIIYTATDFTGNTATETRSLNVRADTPAATVQKGPYLIYDGVNTGMRVLWQLDSSQSCKIVWGKDTSYTTGTESTSENGDGVYDHQHIYAITGLTPGTHYFYKVTCDSNYIGRGSFHSAPSEEADNVKFMVYGDTRSYPVDHDSVNKQMINTYTTDPEYQTITLHVGDWVNDGRLESDWTSQFFDSYYTNTNKFQANIPINGVKGNHEYSGNLFLKYYPYLYEPNSFYWSFDYGPVHIAVIDQYVDYSPGSTQYIWLENDLSSSTKKWKFLVFHEPGWSAGIHENNTDVQNYIQPLAKENGVNIIFAGHNHYYARATVDGIQHITTGGGGAPLYTPDPNYENVMVTAQSHHFCEVEIQGDDLYFTARDASGLEFDSFHMD